jgi:N-acetylglucosaminyldiphosphoundecaprenol N-acetyl-beta-D-mannosaminyltransferase
MTHTIFGVRIDDISRTQVLEKMRAWLGGDRSRIIVTPNAEFLLDARKDPVFLERLNRADLSVADSVSIRYAVAALSTGLLADRHPGVDLVFELAKLCSSEHKAIMLLGGDPESAKGAAQKIRSLYPNVTVTTHDPGKVRMHDGYVEIPHETLFLIKREQPDVIAVALGQGKQEAFMEELKRRVPRMRIMIGVGGAFEMISGQRQRAPEWMRNAGLEWLWRLLIEPKRAKRITGASIVFPFLVASLTLKGNDFIPACKRVFPEVFKQLRQL